MSDIFKSSHLSLAAYLKVQGHKILGTEKIDGNNHYLFAGSEQLEADQLAFFNDEGQVNPRAYDDTIRGLKALVHSKRAK